MLPVTGAAELFPSLATILPGLLKERFGDFQALCVMGTRVTIEIAEHFGLACHPVPTLATAMNAQYLDFASERGRLPAAEEMAGTPMYSVGCDGRTAARDGWPFHLVARVDDIIFDPTSGQFDRPRRGIHMPPALWFRAAPARIYLVALNAGGLVRYVESQDLPGSDKYLSGSDWVAHGTIAELSGQIIQRVMEREVSTNDSPLPMPIL